MRIPDCKSQIEELGLKKQIRRVHIPTSLKGYISKFMYPDRTLLRGSDNVSILNPRTLDYRIKRLLANYMVKDFSLERARKTYMNGKADEQILNNVLGRVCAGTSGESRLDKEWLIAEMQRDLLPLRLLLGATQEKISSAIDVPVEEYSKIEAGMEKITWNVCKELISFYHNRSRTSKVVEVLGVVYEMI